MAGMTTLNPPPEPRRNSGPRRSGLLAAAVLGAGLVAARDLHAADSLLTAPDATVIVRAAIHPQTKEACGGKGRLVFSIREPALLSIPGLPEGGSTLDGVAIGGSDEIRVSPGPHAIDFPGSILQSATSARTLDLRVRNTIGGPPETRTISLRGDIVNRSILPVGRIFLQGVDLMTGHLTMTSTDLQVAGRHLNLDVGRTYAGSAGGEDGAVGARWLFTHESRLTPIDECGLYVVTVGGGSSQTFESRDQGKTFTPQRGHHTSLTRLPDGSFEFVDKSARRFHFSAPDPLGERTRRLLYSEEPHGDRVVYRYDAGGRMVEVTESQFVGSAVRLVARTLRLRWMRVAGADRIRSISAPGLGLDVEYGYDTWGNLTTTTKRDTDIAGAAVDRMTYSTELAADRHRLLSVTPSTGSRMEYRFSGQGQVQEIVERPPKGGEISTTLKFERLPSPATPFRTTARTAALPSDVYVLSPDGRAVRTELTDESGRRVETVVWAQDDVLKESTSDNRGVETRYTYDARGNVIREATTKGPNSQAEVAVSEYHPRFNLLVRQVDTKGAVSTWSLDPRTGDLLEAHNSKGEIEKYRYDSAGRLIEAETAAGKTLFLAHDTFGSATRVRLPSGNIETREYDPRGRRYANDPEPPKK